jgi:hypothetical protein
MLIKDHHCNGTTYQFKPLFCLKPREKVLLKTKAIWRGTPLVYLGVVANEKDDRVNSL